MDAHTDRRRQNDTRFAGKQSNNNNNLYISNDCRVLCLTTPVIYGLGIVAVAGSYGAG